MFIGRRDELDELDRRCRSGRFELGIIYGARRIGKSSLLKAFLQNRRGIYFQARRGTDEENLRALTREIGRFRGEETHYVYDSYESVFDDLAVLARTEQLVFVIDEVAYLCSRGKTFLSVLQAYADGAFRECRMKVLLCGSNISFMKDILNNKADPLYQRATFQIHLQKMKYSEALAFLTRVPPEERLDYLAVFGGYPYYLEMIDPETSFDENIERLLFSKYGTLTDAPNKVLPTGMSEQSMYNSVMTAIARRRRFCKDIADYVGVETNYLSKYLSVMTETQVLEKCESFNRNKKMNYYRIADPLLRFWYRFIYPDQDTILAGAGHMIYQTDREEIHRFISHGFEDTAMAYITEKNLSGALGIYYGPVRSYVADNSPLGRSVELDGLAESIGQEKHTLLVMECKYRQSPFSRAMLDHLVESTSIFSGYDQREYYLFSKSGFTDDIISSRPENVHLFSVKDMQEV